MMNKSQETPESPKRASFILSPPSHEQVGTLARYLTILEQNGVNLKHLESRLSLKNPGRFEFLVECDRVGEFETALLEIKKLADNVEEVKIGDTTPWFPRHISELDKCETITLLYSAELNADHPGFADEVYRARRKYITDVSKKYRYGEPIPRIEYTKDEVETWGKVYRKLKVIYPTHACKEHRCNFALLEQNGVYSEDNIPQLEDVSNFLKDCSGFTIRPATGLISARDFLAMLAFRVFPVTQYIRHSSCPDYTPEPDMCHELLGHIPLYANSSFAQFSQEIGLASLGATDEYVTKLITCLWFTVEYGLCREKDVLRAYGAGLLSSCGELQYCLQDKAELRPLDIFSAAEQSYLMTEYQPIYYVAESFEDAAEQLTKFALKVPKPFGLRYDPYTQSVLVLDSKKCIEDLIKNIMHELQRLSNATKKLN